MMDKAFDAISTVTTHNSNNYSRAFQLYLANVWTSLFNIG